MEPTASCSAYSVISPTLLQDLDINRPIPAEMRIGWEELLGVPVDPSNYIGLVQGPDDDETPSVESLLMVASQLYEELAAEGETAVGNALLFPDDLDDSLEELFVAASQMADRQLRLSPLDGAEAGPSSRFGKPQSEREVQRAKDARVPKKPQSNTDWAENIWHQWAVNRLTQVGAEERATGFSLDCEIRQMDNDSVNYWLQRFVLEVRKVKGEHYCPDSLHQICCGLQRGLRAAGRVETNFFDGTTFAPFRDVLDGELKRLNRTGEYLEKKKAQVITQEMEEILWQKGLLGDHTSQALIDTMVYLIGYSFALRSGEEHRRLRHSPSQLSLVERHGEMPYLVYKEDVSKTNQGGLKQRKIVPKEVIHHANMDNPSRCLVRLYKLYNSLCPQTRPPNAFYLTPLLKPKENCWFKAAVMGHNKLAEVVPRLMRSAGIDGYFTNHSLRVTAATRLYDAQVDEDTIMRRTGHRSVDGVRAYKRTSEKLKELSSSVLNCSSKKPKISTVPGELAKKDVTAFNQENNPSVFLPSNPRPKMDVVAFDQENHPLVAFPPNPPPKPASTTAINFGSATNFTLNFHFGP